MKRHLFRFLIAMAMAAFFAGATLVIAQAQTQTPPTLTPVAGVKTPESTSPGQMTYDQCVDCHQDIKDNWQMGPHGQAMTDPVFVAEWNNQGKPGACRVCHATGYDPVTGVARVDSVSCENCHNPIPANHPDENMPIDKSPDLCGKCHSDTRFATENWQMSSHYKRSMTCTVCHDAHGAGMRQIEGAAITADASALCSNCHKDAMKNFPTSKHFQAGVTCVNCHLGYNLDSADEAGKLDFISAHRAPDHNFVAKLETCNKCHADQMHSPGQAEAAAAIKVEMAGGTATPAPTAAVTPVPHTTTEPAPVSPVGFAAMAGLLGLAGGMVLAPWLERAYRKAKGGNND